jgi:hypothetical protein
MAMRAATLGLGCWLASMDGINQYQFVQLSQGGLPS